MSVPRTIRSRQKREEGIALLIAIFVLLLVCVVGIALIVSSGTESALAGNYRAATGAYYAALAGLEEGRGRLLPKNPNHFSPGFIPITGTPPLVLTEVRYILNPVGGENVLADFPDTEYDKEFPPLGTITGRNVNTINSVSPVAGIPGPLYKWVRINAVTEQSLNVDVDGGGLDSTTELYYDGAHLSLDQSKGRQVLEVTSLAVLPNGTQKLLQYIVAPVDPFTSIGPSFSNFTFPSALTLAGNNVGFTGPNTSSFNGNGNDQYGPAGCTPGSPVNAIGYTNDSDASQSNILNPNVMNHKTHYTGVGGTTPNISFVGASLPPELQTPSGLDSLVQNITQTADKVITGPADQTSLPAGMSSTNPMTVVVNGDFNLHGTISGYGLLVVTGNLDYDPYASWRGIILVIGKGTFTASQSGNGVLRGAIYVAQTRDTFGTLLSSLGPSSFSYTGSDSNGFHFSSCWIANAQPIVTYKTLSFHEIPQ